MSYKLELVNRRAVRTRARIKHFSTRARLSIFRSSKYIYAQIINSDGKVLTAQSDVKAEDKLTKIQSAAEVGKEIAKKAIALGIKEVVFDRGGYKYHGRVKALCEGAREEKLVI